MLQHQVQPFELEDQTKRGHRKILALLLVDPHLNVISTADVPCQTLDWWRDQVLSESDEEEKGLAPMKTGLQRLPMKLKREVFAAVEDLQEFPISMKIAKDVREALIEERKAHVVAYSDAITIGCTISLCEP